MLVYSTLLATEQHSLFEPILQWVPRSTATRLYEFELFQLALNKVRFFVCVYMLLRRRTSLQLCCMMLLLHGHTLQTKLWNKDFLPLQVIREYLAQMSPVTYVTSILMVSHCLLNIGFTHFTWPLHKNCKQQSRDGGSKSGSIKEMMQDRHVDSRDH